MTLEAQLNLIGLFTGPIVAVAIAAIWEGLRRGREQKLTVLRMFFNTRATPADPAYTVAMNLIRIEFSKHATVMAAYRTYMEHVGRDPSPGTETQHDRNVVAQQSLLLKEMMVALGYKVTEAELTTQAYVARGWVEQQARVSQALAALPAIAEASERSATASEVMAAHLRQLPP